MSSCGWVQLLFDISRVGKGSEIFSNNDNKSSAINENDAYDDAHRILKKERKKERRW